MEFDDLDARHVNGLAALCGGCVYWEFPRQFEEAVSPEKARLLKSKWVCCNAPAGRVALSGGDLVGFVQFGAPELFARCAEYESGPVDGDALFIACLFVGAAWRGRGIARSLLGDAAHAARSRGYAAVEAFARRGSANNPSGPLDLYTACGFSVVRDSAEFPLVRSEVGG